MSDPAHLENARYWGTELTQAGPPPTKAATLCRHQCLPRVVEIPLAQRAPGADVRTHRQSPCRHE